MPRELRTFFQRKPEGKHCCQPEKNRQRVDRHHERANVEDGRNVQRDDNPCSSSGVEQSARKIKQEQAGAGGEHRTKKAHSEFIRSENRSTCTNSKSDTWTFAEV